MDDRAIHRRAPSAEVVALRAERQLLAGVRRRIEALQRRVAFIDAQALSSRPVSTEETAAVTGDIRRVASTVGDEIDELMQGEVGVGPAVDCRRALAHIEERLSAR